MLPQERKTTDHEEIRIWVEERNGKPACIRGVGEKSATGLLRIHFPGGVEEDLEVLEWETFFEKFDQEKLIFVYLDKRIDGELSRYNDIINY